MAIEIKKSHEGLFHKNVGKAPGAKITSADIAKGLASKDPAVRKRANFAKVARTWHHSKGKPKRDPAKSLYGAKS